MDRIRRTQQGCTIVLEDRPENKPGSENLPFSENTEGTVAVRSSGFRLQKEKSRMTGLQKPFAQPAEADVPDRILEMKKLYEYGPVSFEQKCRNFYRQGKFMEDYEDDMPWDGEYRHYYTTYHDLNVPQLRGYFTWRTAVRKGNYLPISLSLAYLYIYELLCQIGADSPEDSLLKMKDFEKGFLDTGYGDENMRRNLHRWMLEYAIVHALPAETVRTLADPAVLRRDQALSILRESGQHSDEEVFEALCVFDGKKLPKSHILKREEEKGKHLFASVWRYVQEQSSEDKTDFFTRCFGKEKTHAWHPLDNAIHWENGVHADTVYELDACRSYICKSGKWEVKQYAFLYFNQNIFSGLLHEADRVLRKFFKTGHYLKKKDGEAWATPYIEAVIAREKQEEAEASRPKIMIDFSGLEQIRRDASITRDSLLVEEDEEMGFPGILPGTADEMGFSGILPGTADEMEEPGILSGRSEKAGMPEKGKEKAEESEILKKSAGKTTEAAIAELSSDSVETGRKTLPAENGSDASDMEETVTPDPVSQTVLRMLLAGEDPGNFIRKNFLMPSLVADTVNETFSEEIGDNVLECDGDRLTLVEDYKEDIREILKGMKE